MCIFIGEGNGGDDDDDVEETSRTGRGWAEVLSLLHVVLLDCA